MTDPPKSQPSHQSTRDFPTVVGAAVLDAHGRVFLFQSSGKFEAMWIIPGGKIAFGETMIDALKREFREETGLEIQNVEFLGVQELIEPEHHLICLEFIAHADSRVSITLNEEAVAYRWLSAAELNSVKIVPLTRKFLDELVAQKLIQ